MARIINFSIEVTDEEMQNFLFRMSGADGRKIEAQEENDTPEESGTTDKNGVEWNADFHASSKALNADGTWRRRRGLSDAEIAAAEAYEKGVAPAEPVAPVAPAEPAEPAAPAAPVGLPGMPAAPTPVSYEEVVALYQAAVAKKPDLDVAGLYAAAGVTDPNVLNTDEGAALRIELAKLFKAV